jgi:hypothetical protein
MIPTACVTVGSVSRGKGSGNPQLSVSIGRVSSDPIGTTTVTFSGVNPDNEIRVYRQDRTELAGVENCVENQTLTWDVYAYGNPNNNVRIVIVSIDYGIMEFNYTSQLGNQSIPIQQEEDPWFRDPA